MCSRFFVRLPNDDDAILYVSLGGIGQDDGKDANRRRTEPSGGLCAVLP